MSREDVTNRLERGIYEFYRIFMIVSLAATPFLIVYDASRNDNPKQEDKQEITPTTTTTTIPLSASVTVEHIND